MTTCSTRKIEPVWRFLGTQTRCAQTHRRAGIDGSCGLPARGGLRAVQGAGITLFALLFRPIENLDSLDAQFSSRVAAVYQNLVSHKDSAA